MRRLIVLSLLLVGSWSTYTLARMDLAELHHPLTISSLWQRRTYANDRTELKSINRALRAFPKHGEYYSRLADLYGRWVGFRAKIRDVDALLGSATGASPTSKQSQQIIQLAIAAYKRAILLNPSQSLLHLRLAWFYHHVGQQGSLGAGPTLAALQMDRALALNPRHLTIRLHASMFYLHAGKTDKALALARETVQLAPRETLDYVNRLHGHFGNFSFLKKIAPDTNVISLLEFTHRMWQYKPVEHRQEVLGALIPVLEKAQGFAPGYHPLLFAIAYTYENLDDLQCLRWYLQALHSTDDISKRVRVLTRMVDFHLGQREPAKAWRLLSSHFSPPEASASLWILRSRVQNAMGNKISAISDLQNAVATPAGLREEELFAAKDRLARLYLATGQYRLAKAVWEDLLAWSINTGKLKDRQKGLLGQIKDAERQLGGSY